MSPSTAFAVRGTSQSNDNEDPRHFPPSKVAAGQKHRHASCSSSPSSAGTSHSTLSDPSSSFSSPAATTFKRRRAASFAIDCSTIHNLVNGSSSEVSGAFCQENKTFVTIPDIDYAAPNVCEFIKDCLYFTWTQIEPISTARTTYFTVDQYLRYVPFFSDFGPFNLAHIVRFCSLVKERLQLARLQGKVLCIYTKPQDDKRANAAFAIASYMMIQHQLTPEVAYRPLKHVQPPFEPYRDASFGPSVFSISIMDCLRGLYRGLQHGLIHLDKFDVKEYEYYEQVSNGDFNWITPNIIAFAAPIERLTYDQVQEYAKRSSRRRTSPSSSLSSSSPGQSEGNSTSTPSAVPPSLPSDPSSRSSSRSITPPAIDLWLSTPSSTAASTPSDNGSSVMTSTTSSSACVVADYVSKHDGALSSCKQSISPQPPVMEGGDQGGVRTGGTLTARANQTQQKKRTTIKRAFESLLTYFEHQAHVEVIVRLNEKTYDEEFFTSKGMKHVEMTFSDGSCPPLAVVRKFLALCDLVIHGQRRDAASNSKEDNTDNRQEIAAIASDDKGHNVQKVDETESMSMEDVRFDSSPPSKLSPTSPRTKSGGVLAVHCKAGLGRTGTLIAVYLMRTYGMTAREAIAFLRIMRPGSVVGHQQTWLESHEQRILRWKDEPLGPVVEQCHRLPGRYHPIVESVWSDNDDSQDDDHDERQLQRMDGSDGETQGGNDGSDEEREYEIDVEAAGTNDDSGSVERDPLDFEEQVTQVLNRKLVSISDIMEREKEEDGDDDESQQQYPIPVQPRKSAVHDMHLGLDETMEGVSTDGLLLLDRDPLTQLQQVKTFSADVTSTSLNVHTDGREIAI